MSNRFLPLYRSLPYRVLPADVVSDDRPLAPGQFGVAAIDEYGIQYARLISGEEPTPVDFSKYDVYIQNVAKYGQRATPPEQWGVYHAPAGNVQATITRPAIAGSYHVITSISARLLCGTGFIAAAPVSVFLRDGATAVWGEHIEIAGTPAVPGQEQIKLGGFALAGSLGASMTLEFSAAGGANSRESVAMTGYTVTP